MNIGIVDVDNYKNTKDCFPNLPLMKISAYHKRNGDNVEFHDPQKEYDIVYMSKVFSFSEDYPYEVKAKQVKKGGGGYAISVIDGKEFYDKKKDESLPYEIEHIYPDYYLYGIEDTAYGFIQRGCPRGCDFCHVKEMQGLIPHKVADLSEFWNGQKNIVLLDPNITACKDWKEIFQQLIDSKAYVDFSQGLDIRFMTEEKAKMLSKIRIRSVHFAYDRYQDKNIVEKKFIELKEQTNWGRSKVMVYVLVGFDTTLEQDLERIMFLRKLNFQPYVMRYNKQSLKRGNILNKLARWVNFIPLFWKYETFEDYLKNETKIKTEQLSLF